jgi:retron-type reverse transcriptase
VALTTLAHHIDIGWLHEAYRRTRKDGATGVDRQTADEYAANLEDNLRSLLDRAKSGTYRAPPVRRVHIPKGSGAETRPIGIPTFEDKVLQRAVAMVLEAVYEQDFLDCSYGFRPSRSAHQALDTLLRGLNERSNRGCREGRRSSATQTTRCSCLSASEMRTRSWPCFRSDSRSTG